MTAHLINLFINPSTRVQGLPAMISPLAKACAMPPAPINPIFIFIPKSGRQQQSRQLPDTQMNWNGSLHKRGRKQQDKHVITANMRVAIISVSICSMPHSECAHKADSVWFVIDTQRYGRKLGWVFLMTLADHRLSDMDRRAMLVWASVNEFGKSMHFAVGKMKILFYCKEKDWK